MYFLQTQNRLFSSEPVPSGEILDDHYLRPILLRRLGLKMFVAEALVRPVVAGPETGTGPEKE